MREYTEDERKEREERLETKRREYLCKHFGPRYQEATFSKIHESLALTGQSLIFDWLKGRKHMLVLIGPPGTGKTYVCAAIASAALRLFNSPRYWKEELLFNHCRDAIDSTGDYVKTLQYALDDDFSMIDDIGSTPVNNWRKEVIFNAVDIRYNSMLPTVFTSNLNREEIKRDYEERTSSRLFAAENTVIDLFGNQDLRQFKVINGNTKADTDQT